MSSLQLNDTIYFCR